VLAEANSALELLPSEYFRRNFVITTSGMTTAPPLRLALDALGVERIQFAGAIAPTKMSGPAWTSSSRQPERSGALGDLRHQRHGLLHLPKIIRSRPPGPAEAPDPGRG
jgi:hypothetical protein